MGRRLRTWIIRGVAAGALAAMVTAGVVALNGGLTERRNAAVLAAPDSVFLTAVGTVKADAGHTEWSQMPVTFVTASGESVKTMVWTRRGNRDFHAGRHVDLEYVADHPAAARLAGDAGGPEKSMGTILTGAAILAGSVMLAAAWSWDLVTSRRRRRQA